MSEGWTAPRLTLRCLTENTVLDLVEGRLDAGARAALHRHVDQCAACRRLVAEATDALLSAPGDPTKASPGPPDELLAPPAFAGDRIDEYRIERPLGRGGFGRVYLAHDIHLDRPVALKLLAGVPDEKQRQRFRAEARAVARLHHPNVMAVYRVGEVDGHPYLAAEYIRGQNLRRLEKPVPWQRALQIGLGLARGLGAAHRRGVLHRDVTSANVMITPEGEVKLLDFGLAKLRGEPATRTAERLSAGASLDTSDVASRLTGTGAVVGTPLYIAPEVYRGAPATCASDVYSAGAVLYELCTGRAPLEDPALALVERERRPAPIEHVPSLEGRVSGVAPAFAAVIDRCLRADPAERFASGDDLLDALETIAPSTTSSSRRRRVAAWLGVSLAVAAAMTYSVVGHFGGGRGPEPSPVVVSPPELPRATEEPVIEGWRRDPVPQLFLIARLPVHRGAMMTRDGGVAYVGSWGDNKVFQVPLTAGSTAKLLYTSPGSSVVSRGSGVSGVEVQGDQIVWADHGSGTLFTAPKDGSGTPRPVREGLRGIYGFHTDATSIYWMDADGIAPGTLWKTPKAGGDSTVVSAGAGSEGADVVLGGPGGGLVFTDATKDAVFVAPPGGGAASVLATVGAQPNQIAESDDAYYVAVYSSNAIVRIDKATRATSTVISGMGTPSGVAVDATTVYWVTYSNPSVWGLRR